MLAFLKNISPTEIIILVAILVLLFGGKVITKMAKTAGESLKEVKKIKETFTEVADTVGGNKEGKKTI